MVGSAVEMMVTSMAATKTQAQRQSITKATCSLGWVEGDEASFPGLSECGCCDESIELALEACCGIAALLSGEMAGKLFELYAESCWIIERVRVVDMAAAACC